MPCRGCSSVYPLNILGGGGREEQNLGYSISMAICAGWWPLRVKLRFARGISGRKIVCAVSRPGLKPESRPYNFVRCISRAVR